MSSERARWLRLSRRTEHSDEKQRGVSPWAIYWATLLHIQFVFEVANWLAGWVVGWLVGNPVMVVIIIKLFHNPESTDPVMVSLGMVSLLPVQ